MSNLLKFPDGFLWGTATSAHQVEGDNLNDWTEWEKENAERLAREARIYWQPWQQKKFLEMFSPENYISGRATDHYNRYEEDFDLAKVMNNNAHRFSIEWSRIEPEEGKFDEKEIEHYRQVIWALKKRGIEPFVTLWHYTNPIWFQKKGGWLNKNSPKYFERYANKISRSLQNVKFWITLNEPDDIYAFYAYYTGRYPPQEKSFRKTWRALNNLVSAHKKAYRKIHENCPSSMVGFANNIIYFESKGIIARIIKIFANKYWNFWFLRKTFSYNDFIGCSFYRHNTLSSFKVNQNENIETTDIGWEIYPKGIYYVLKELKKYQKPIYITENGLADAQDKYREKFIIGHLNWIHKAITEGVDVRGYFYWSLLDNFEWDKGFWPRFGLVEIDYQTMERKVRPSAQEYAKICKNNGLIT